MTAAAREGFPAALDRWTAADGEEHPDRIECGEGCARVIDTITRHRARTVDAEAEAIR